MSTVVKIALGIVLGGGLLIGIVAGTVLLVEEAEQGGAPTAEETGGTVDEERLGQDAMTLLRSCERAMEYAYGDGPEPRAARMSRALDAADRLVEAGQEAPDAQVEEFGTVKQMLLETASGVDDPACFPDQAEQLKAAVE